MQDTGIVIQSWPAILDYDVAGEIHEVGPGVARFRRGDRVVAYVCQNTAIATHIDPMPDLLLGQSVRIPSTGPSSYTRRHELAKSQTCRTTCLSPTQVSCL